jgi:SAM-dependent methyltransferase
MREEEYGRMRVLEDDHWWYRGLRDLVCDRIGEAGRILDAGCGTGGMLARLAGRDAVGVDISGTALSLARERGLGRLVRASACSLPFRDDAFDVVLSLDVIYHRSVPGDRLAVAECARVVRPGGIVAIHAPAYRCLAGRHDRAVHGVRRYTRGEVEELVLDAGLVPLELTYRNLPVLPLAAAIRLLQGKEDEGSTAREPSSDLRPLPSILNAAAARVARAENAFLRRFSLPAGLSVWCVAQKPPADPHIPSFPPRARWHA